jgi:hypothetical protein
MIDTDMEQLSKISANNQRLLNDFKARHPNNAEDLPLTPENIARMQWHLKQELRKGDFVEIEYKENATARQMANTRRFETWGQMPPYMRVNYLRIADQYAGSQVFACGSRVNGEYLERWSSNDVRDMRSGLMKSEKEESDYDFTGAEIRKSRYFTCEGSETHYTSKSLNINADYIHHQNPNDHKIAIPMWDFSKLPDDKKQEARELYADQKWGLLMKMHNDYGLSENQYCCDEKPIIKWFKWAIDNGKI